MATYKIFLRTGNEFANVSADAVCDSDREASELAQRMLEDGSDRDGRAEIWAGSRFVGVVSPTSAEDIARLGRSPEQWSE